MNGNKVGVKVVEEGLSFPISTHTCLTFSVAMSPIDYSLRYVHTYLHAYKKLNICLWYVFI